MTPDRKDIEVHPDKHLPSSAVELGTNPPAEIFAQLTPFERKAVIAYVESGSYSEALRVMDAWDTEGLPRPSSDAKLARQASAFFAKPRIRAAIARLEAFWAEQTSLVAGRVLNALEAQAFADPALIYEEDGATWQLKPMSEWPLHLRQTVHKIHYTEITSGYGRLKRVTKRVNVDFANRQAALEMLGRHLHLFDKAQEHTVPFTLVVNSAPPPPEDPKQVGPQVIEGIGLQIRLPEK